MSEEHLNEVIGQAIFRDWEHLTDVHSFEVLQSFMVGHSEDTNQVKKEFLATVLPEIFIVSLESGKNWTVHSFLRILKRWNEFAQLEINIEKLRRNCLISFLKYTPRKPTLDEFLISYPSDVEFLKDFWNENRDWLDPTRQPGVPSGPQTEFIPGSGPQNVPFQAVLNDAKTVLMRESEIISEDSLPQTVNSIFSPGDSISISEQYNIQGYIGKGGQKEVHSVMQWSTGQRLALKVLFNENSGREELIEEAKIQSILSHQGVPAIFSLAVDSGQKPILVERFIDGNTWSEIFFGLSVRKNLKILEKVAQILASAHYKHRIIHGDLKPLNVKVDQEYNEVYLVDWGLAIQLDNKPKNWFPRGTLDYLPPEVAQGDLDQICAGTDVFMLGAILYQILTGRGPYTEIYFRRGPYVAKDYARDCDWPPLPEVGVEGPIPYELKQILEKAMEKEPKNRYLDARYFAVALANYSERSNILERFEKARNCFCEFPEKFRNVQNDLHAQSLVLSELIGNVNELSLIVVDLAETEKEEQKSSMFREVFSTEIVARTFLLERMIFLRDYAQAIAQVEINQQQLAKYEAFFPDHSENDEKPFFQSQEQALEKANLDIQHGLAVRRRERFMQWTVCILGLAVLLTVVGILRIQGLREQEKAEGERRLRIASQKEENLMRENLYQKNLELCAMADYQAFGQGMLAMESLLEEFPHKIPTAWQKECTFRTSLLPVKSAPYSEEVTSVAFSGDEKYFITKTVDNYLSCWELEGKRNISRQKIGFSINLEGTSILPNPCFTQCDAPKVENASEFLLVTRNGDLIYWGHSGPVKKSFVVNLLKVNAGQLTRKDLLELGHPVFHKMNSQWEMVIGNKQGSLFFFSLPDGKLRKFVPVAHEGSIINLAMAPNQQFLVTAGADGTLKCWKPDGVLRETLDLRFSETGVAPFRTLDISPDSTKLAVGAETGEIRIYDFGAHTLMPVKIQETKERESQNVGILRVFWLENSRLLSFCQNGHCKTWNLGTILSDTIPESGDLGAVKYMTVGGMTAAALSQSRTKLIFGEENSILAFIDLETNEVYTSDGIIRNRKNDLTLPFNPVFHPGLERMIVGNVGKKSIWLYNTDDLTMMNLFAAAEKEVPLAVAVPREGNRFVVAYEGGSIRFYEGATCVGEVEKDEEKKQEDEHENRKYVHISLSPDGELLAETTRKGNEIKIRSWKSPEKEVIKTISRATLWDHIENLQVRAMYFTRNQAALILIAYDGKMVRWDLEKEQVVEKAELWEESSCNFYASSAISWDGTQLAVGSKLGIVSIVNVEDFSVVKHIRSLGMPLVSQTSKYETSWNGNGQMTSVLGIENSVSGLVWAPGDRILAVSFSSGKTVLVDSVYQVEMASIFCGERTNDAQDPLMVVPVFSNKGHLLTVGSDAAIYRWDYRPSTEQISVKYLETGMKRITAWQSGKIIGMPFDNRFMNPLFMESVTDGNQIREGGIDFAIWRDGEKEFLLLLDENWALEALDAEGKAVKDCEVLYAEGFPELVMQIRVSPDSRWIAARTIQQRVYLLDSYKKEKRWIPVSLKEPKHGDELEVCQIQFSPDSKELVCILGKGGNVFWNLERMERCAECNYDVPQNQVLTENQSTISEIFYTRSGNFLIQTLIGNVVMIWNRNTCKPFQIMKLGNFERYSLLNLTGLSNSTFVEGIEILDRGFGEWENEDAFVVWGLDGILRFYQYIPEEGKFVNIYVVSSLQLARVVEPMEISKFSLLEYSLYLSRDRKTLFAGTPTKILAFNMSEIRRNVSNLAMRWKSVRTEELTALSWNQNDGLAVINLNSLKKVE